jgi:hypothetical protein
VGSDGLLRAAPKQLEVLRYYALAIEPVVAALRERGGTA